MKCKIYYRDQLIGVVKSNVESKILLKIIANSRISKCEWRIQDVESDLNVSLGEKNVVDFLRWVLLSIQKKEIVSLRLVKKKLFSSRSIDIEYLTVNQGIQLFDQYVMGGDNLFQNFSEMLIISDSFEIFFSRRPEASLIERFAGVYSLSVPGKFVFEGYLDSLQARKLLALNCIVNSRGGGNCVFENPAGEVVGRYSEKVLYQILESIMESNSDSWFTVPSLNSNLEWFSGRDAFRAFKNIVNNNDKGIFINYYGTMIIRCF